MLMDGLSENAFIEDVHVQISPSQIKSEEQENEQSTELGPEPVNHPVVVNNDVPNDDPIEDNDISNDIPQNENAPEPSKVVIPPLPPQQSKRKQTFPVKKILSPQASADESSSLENENFEDNTENIDDNDEDYVPSLTSDVDDDHNENESVPDPESKEGKEAAERLLQQQTRVQEATVKSDPFIRVMSPNLFMCVFHNHRTSEKAEKCKLHCAEVKSKRAELTYHIWLKHLNLKPFQCHLCDTAFAARHALVPHLYRHRNPHPHHCGSCEAKYSSLKDLKKHLIKNPQHKPEREPRKSTKQLSLERKALEAKTKKTKVKSKKTKYACKVKDCNAVYKVSTSLARHMRQTHPTIVKNRPEKKKPSKKTVEPKKTAKKSKKKVVQKKTIKKSKAKVEKKKKKTVTKKSAEVQSNVE